MVGVTGSIPVAPTILRPDGLRVAQPRGDRQNEACPAKLERSESVDGLFPRRGSLSIAGSPDTTTITGVATSIALFIGSAPQGPLDRALRIAGFSIRTKLRRPRCRVAARHAIGQFYDKGGVDAYVLRLDRRSRCRLSRSADGRVRGRRRGREIDLFNLVCVPGLADAAAILMLQQRARERRAFLIVDCVEGADAAASKPTRRNKRRGRGQRGAVLSLGADARPAATECLRASPPCGFVAGIFARSAARAGYGKRLPGWRFACRRGRTWRDRRRGRHRAAQPPRHQLPACDPLAGIVVGARERSAARPIRSGSTLPCAPRAVHRTEPVARHAMGRVRAQ